MTNYEFKKAMKRMVIIVIVFFLVIICADVYIMNFRKAEISLYGDNKVVAEENIVEPSDKQIEEMSENTMIEE